MVGQEDIRHSPVALLCKYLFWQRRRWLTFASTTAAFVATHPLEFPLHLIFNSHILDSIHLEFAVSIEGISVSTEVQKQSTRKKTAKYQHKNAVNVRKNRENLSENLNNYIAFVVVVLRCLEGLVIFFGPTP